MAPEPMPTHDQDPDIKAAREAQAQYLEALQTARADYRLSDLAKAEAVDAAYTTYRTALQGAWDRIQGRRKARLEHLENLVPIGPGIPADATPADCAVLMTAFRAALERAEALDRAGRAKMLHDAERWDDDAARRGALTAIVDASDWHTIKAWAQQHLTTAGYVEEVVALRSALTGTSSETTARFAVRECSPVRPPAEVVELPRLLAMRGAAQTAGQRSSAASQAYAASHSRFPRPGRLA
ncbi:hypothetical protein [Streptomyces sp. NPDC101132]|uniref:hypothetical protein n=1 Tax=Streptomyces sp. NPDC101132 TaxID=3366110 RepID=UPI00381DE0B7